MLAWPIRPKPVTSVHACASTVPIASAAARFRVAICSAAGRMSSQPILLRIAAVVIAPMPGDLVR